MGFVDISALGLRCDVCNFTWVPFDDELPNECPNCHASDWYKVKGNKTKGINTKLEIEDEFNTLRIGDSWKKADLKKVTPNNTLNNLSGTQWIKFTKSWFIHNPPPRKESEILHPAKFPEDLAKEFISFFTKENGVVLDPFMGSGSTIVACEEMGRVGIGIEISPKYFDIAKERCMGAQRKLLLNFLEPKLILGDAMNSGELLSKTLKESGLDAIDLVLTSPPYWNMLKQSRGGVESTSKKRDSAGLDTHYSDDERDIGNIDDYETFIDSIFSIFSSIKPYLKANAYIVIIMQNVRIATGEMKPLAWDIANRLRAIFTLKQEKIWCQDNKQLGIWGYPSEYVSNVHHHYCLIFQNKLM